MLIYKIINIFVVNCKTRVKKRNVWKWVGWIAGNNTKSFSKIKSLFGFLTIKKNKKNNDNLNNKS